ncbi:gasdermin [Streptomyces phaeochromogenes]
MGFLNCGEHDPWMKLLMEQYQASVVRTPQSGILPLLMLARDGDRIERRGEIVPVIEGSESVNLPPTQTDVAASISGERTREIKAKLSLELTAKFLQALGVPVPGASLNAQLFNGARSLSFEVSDVRQLRVDPNELGKALAGRRIDLDHPSVEVFLGKNRVDALVITRVLTSPKFAVHASADSGQSVEVDVNGIKDLIGEASIKVDWKATSKSSITFTGPSHVTFAFSCVPLNLRDDGSFTIGLEIRPDDARWAHTEQSQSPGLLRKEAPAVPEPGLLEW